MSADLQWLVKADAWLCANEDRENGIRGSIADLLKTLEWSEDERKALSRAVGTYKRERSIARTRAALELITTQMAQVGCGLEITFEDDVDGMRFVVHDSETNHEFQLVVDGVDV